VSGRIAGPVDTDLGRRRPVAGTGTRVLGRGIDPVEGIAVAGRI
jgi:hypothetical protein